MKKKDSAIHVFENEILTFKSYVNEFTFDIYQNFDLKSDELCLPLKIDDLFIGKKVNNTEGRAALHPKYRDEYSSNEIFKYIKLFQSARNIVTIGIGGSFEGPKLLIESMGHTTQNHIFITGSDLNEFEEKIKKLSQKETIFIVSSKSFRTDETIQTLKNAQAWLDDNSKFIAITANKLEAKKHDINNIIEIDDEIGGRYSIWSDISLPAYFEGYPSYKQKFLQGGKQADIDFRDNEEYFKFIKHLSFSDIWLNNYNKKNTRVILSYIWSLRSLPNYFQQLEMESLGKKFRKGSDFKKTGQIIFGGYGPTAQHSYFQLLHQGTQEICADIITTMNDIDSLAYAQAITQSKLLSFGANDSLDNHEKINGNVPLNIFLLKNVDPFTIGYLIATWEHRTYVSAVMLEINPFDQFGVNAGKIYTKKYLADKD